MYNKDLIDSLSDIHTGLDKLPNVRLVTEAKTSVERLIEQLRWDQVEPNPVVVNKQPIENFSNQELLAEISKRMSGCAYAASGPGFVH
jgi:hypothetical protein